MTSEHRPVVAHFLVELQHRQSRQVLLHPSITLQPATERNYFHKSWISLMRTVEERYRFEKSNFCLRISLQPVAVKLPRSWRGLYPNVYGVWVIPKCLWGIYEGLLRTKYRICIYPCYVAYMNAMRNKSINKHVRYKLKVSDKTKRCPTQLKDVW